MKRSVSVSSNGNSKKEEVFSGNDDVEKSDKSDRSISFSSSFSASMTSLSALPTIPSSITKRRMNLNYNYLYSLMLIPIVITVVSISKRQFATHQYGDLYTMARREAEENIFNTLQSTLNKEVEKMKDVKSMENKKVKAKVMYHFKRRVEEEVQTRINDRGLVEYQDIEEAKEIEFKQRIEKEVEARLYAASNLGPRTIEGLEPDPSFLASDKYKHMKKNAYAKYDMDLLKKEFEEKGVIRFLPEYPDGALDGAANLTRQILNKCSTPPFPDECQYMHVERLLDDEAVKKVALNYDILSVLAVLHGHDPYPFQTLNFPKSSGSRTHSDYIHFAAHPIPLMSGVWVALMDISPDSGPMYYYEGSHKNAPYNMQDLGLDDRTKEGNNYELYQDIMTATMERQGLIYREAVVEKGWVFIWAANLVYGEAFVRNPELERFSQITHYFYHNSNYQWAPVASDLEHDVVTYYDETALEFKLSEKGTTTERKEMQKFVIGACDLITQGKEGVPTPCDHKHPVPQVMSKLLQKGTEEK